MEMTFTEILEVGASIIASLGGGGAIVFALSSYLGKRWADSALQVQRQEHTRLNLELTHQLGLLTEQTRHTLQMAALEHQVRFSKLHDVRAQRIADLYERIVKQSVDCQRYAYHLKESTRHDEFSKLERNFSDFFLFFDASRIYLPEHVCVLLEKVISTLRKHVIGVFVYSDTDKHANDAVRKEKKDTFMAAIAAFEEEIPAAKRALEDEFRQILGVETTPATAVLDAFTD